LCDHEGRSWDEETKAAFHRDNPYPRRITAKCGHQIDVSSPGHCRKAEEKGCPACRSIAHEEHQMRSKREAEIRKSEMGDGGFPVGTLIALKKMPDGVWKGTIDAENLSSVCSHLSLKEVMRDLKHQARRWAKAGLTAGELTPAQPDKPIRIKSKSVLDMRHPKKRLSRDSIATILREVDRRRIKDVIRQQAEDATKNSSTSAGGGL
jgi:hypothetical protein